MNEIIEKEMIEHPERFERLEANDFDKLEWVNIQVALPEMRKMEVLLENWNHTIFDGNIFIVEMNGEFNEIIRRKGEFK
jgi:hypothetical protein